MHILSIIMLGIAANLDNLGIGLAYGIRRIRIPLGSNLIIAGISGLSTAFTGFGGHLLSQMMPDGLGNILGGGLVITVGIWTIAYYYRDNKKNIAFSNPDEEINVQNLKMIVREPHKADLDYSGHISAKEAILLGIALAMNAMATGLGAGMTGINVLGITISVIFFSLLTISCGDYMGKQYASVLGDKSTLVAGIMLIVVGIYEIFI